MAGQRVDPVRAERGAVTASTYLVLKDLPGVATYTRSMKRRQLRAVQPEPWDGFESIPCDRAVLGSI